MGNRKAAEAALLKWIDALLPGSPNKKIYEDRLAKMSDKDFEAFIGRLESEEEVLSLIAPNLDDFKLTVANNLKVAERIGHNFFERLWLTDHITGKTYLTPVPYLVIDLPLRRQQQMLVKKISIPEDNKHVDELSGQPTGPSKGARISFPELQVLFAQNMDKSLTELIKLRGGDEKAFRAMNAKVIETGGVSVDQIASAGTKVKSTQTLGTLLRAMHLRPTAL
jgi:hypothetical protein